MLKHPERKNLFMRIAILYNRDIYANRALNHLLPRLANHQLGLFYSELVGSARALDPRLIHLSKIERLLFNDVIFPMLDANSMTANQGTFTQLARLAKTKEIALASINNPEGLELLKKFAPDLILSIRFGQILQSKAIAIPSKGVLNLHSGILPQYRGVMATFWSLLNEDAEIGTTVHFIENASIDKGPIVSIRRLPVCRNKSYFQQVMNLYEGGCDDLLAAVHKVSLGIPLKKLTSSHNTGSYHSFPDSVALDQARQRDIILVSPADISALVNAFLGQRYFD